jgi:hypothetical protein
VNSDPCVLRMTNRQAKVAQIALPDFSVHCSSTPIIAAQRITIAQQAALIAQLEQQVAELTQMVACAARFRTERWAVKFEAKVTYNASACQLLPF